MKKILIILAVFVVFALTWASLYKEEVVPVPVATSTATSSALETTTATVDYSKLGKDRFYTEEEGRYENLNEQEKKVIQKVAQLEYGDYSTWSEHKKNENLPFIGIIALSGGYSLVYFSSPSPRTSYALFDLSKNTKIPFPFSWDFLNSRYKLSDQIFLFVQDKGLVYYKLGATQYSIVSDSELPADKSYSYIAGMGFKDSEITLKNGTLTALLFSPGQVWEEGEKPKGIDKKAFVIK